MERNTCPNIVSNSIWEEKLVGDKADCAENQNPQNDGKGRHGWPPHSQVLQTSDYLRKSKDAGNPSNEKHGETGKEPLPENTPPCRAVLLFTASKALSSAGMKQKCRAFLSEEERSPNRKKKRHSPTVPRTSCTAAAPFCFRKTELNLPEPKSCSA